MSDGDWAAEDVGEFDGSPVGDIVPTCLLADLGEGEGDDAGDFDGDAFVLGDLGESEGDAVEDFDDDDFGRDLAGELAGNSETLFARDFALDVGGDFEGERA